VKFAAERPYADPDKAARKLIEIANTIEAIHDGRLHIEKINAPFLAASGSPAEYMAGLDLAIAKGWLWKHDSGTYVKFTQAERGPLRLIRSMDYWGFLQRCFDAPAQELPQRVIILTGPGVNHCAAAGAIEASGPVVITSKYLCCFEYESAHGAGEYNSRSGSHQGQCYRSLKSSGVPERIGATGL
jgi:hypothetical protein